MFHGGQAFRVERTAPGAVRVTAAESSGFTVGPPELRPLVSERLVRRGESLLIAAANGDRCRVDYSAPGHRSRVGFEGPMSFLVLRRPATRTPLADRIEARKTA